MPRPLDLDRLRQFEPAPAVEIKAAVPTAAAPDPVPAPPAEPQRWPSREPIRDGQVSIKAPLDVIERFRSLCRDDRRTYADMLGILMDGNERRR